MDQIRVGPSEDNMDIGAGRGYPSSALSNFAPHPFVMDGIECASMEGFLQGLKFKNPEMQKEICKLVGLKAKQAGRNKNWQESQTLWWKGNPIKRESQEYQELLDDAYHALFQNGSFRKALEATGDAVLSHTIGRTNARETVLTRNEFCSRLTNLRNVLAARKVVGY